MMVPLVSSAVFIAMFSTAVSAADRSRPVAPPAAVPICEYDFTGAPDAYRMAFQNLLEAGLPSAHVVAYLPVTADEINTLVTTGRLEFADDPYRIVSEVGIHAAVDARLRQTQEDPAISDAAFAREFARADAWTESVRAMIEVRARAEGRSSPRRMRGLRAFLDRLRENAPRTQEFSPTLRQLTDAAAELAGFPDPAAALRALVGDGSPVDYFSRLPKHAGFVLAVQEDAFSKLIFAPEDSVRVRSIALDDLAGARDEAASAAARQNRKATRTTEH